MEPAQVYNGDGARVSRNGARIRRAGSSVTSPVLSDAPGRRVVPGLGEATDPYCFMTYLSDRLGTTNALSDGSGNGLHATLETDAFGVPLGRWLQPGLIPTSSPSGFAGGWGYADEGGGLHLVGHRWYDADAGRFLTRDPARQGRNPWSYCGSDPVNGVDPTGLVRIEIRYEDIGIGRYHMVLVIIDNVGGSKTFGQAWFFEGEPQYRGTGALGKKGKLVGNVSRGKASDRPSAYTEVLIDDKSLPEAHLISVWDATRRIENSGQDYDSISGPNSNTYMRVLLELMGLLDVHKKKGRLVPWRLPTTKSGNPRPTPGYDAPWRPIR